MVFFLEISNNQNALEDNLEKKKKEVRSVEPICLMMFDAFNNVCSIFLSARV
jgi:hypothetical protein